MFRRYRIEHWTDRKLQKAFASFPKSAKEQKFLHINEQSNVQKKKEQIQTLLDDLGDNIEYGLYENRLKASNDQIFWELNKNHFRHLGSI